MFHLTPSAIARDYFQDCERYLRYRVAPREEREGCGIPDRQFDHSPLMRAVLAAGSLWEREVVEKLARGRLFVFLARVVLALHHPDPDVLPHGQLVGHGFLCPTPARGRLHHISHLTLYREPIPWPRAAEKTVLGRRRCVAASA